MSVHWEQIPNVEPLIGPEKPIACVNGWASHVWTLRLDAWGNGVSLVTDECNLCTDGITEGDDLEALVGEFKVRLSFDSDHGPEGEGLGGWHYDQRCDCNWWWNVEPAASSDAELRSRDEAVIRAALDFCEWHDPRIVRSARNYHYDIIIAAVEVTP